MTRRTELEPISMTAIEWPTSSRPWAGTVARARLTPFAAARKAAGRGVLERFATARQARIGHEVFMGVERLFARRGLDTHRGAVGQEVPALCIVFEVGNHDLVHDLLMHGRIGDRAQYFHPAIEIAR